MATRRRDSPATREAEIDSLEATLDSAHHTWTILSGRVEAFVNAWEAAADPPSLQNFLPAQPPAIRHLTLVELIKVDLEYRWIHRHLPRTMEDYLAEYPELRHDLPPDLIYEEYHIRRQAGEPVSTQDYLLRFPQSVAELERLLGLNAAEQSTSLFRDHKSPVPQIQPGERLDDFDLLLLLGKGAFASVFLARQNSMQRLVALKLSADRGTEAQTLAQLDHESIVRVFDQRVLPDRKLRLLYMQYVPGGTLHAIVDLVRQTPEGERSGLLLLTGISQALSSRGESLPEESALKSRWANRSWPDVVSAIGAKLARGLDHAHRNGVLHRDIKPANVLVAVDGSPKLADFNIGFSSKVSGSTPAAYFGGSVAYMSPEQLEACNPAHDREPETLDGRSDLYSLGVMLWELLTGFRPFLDEQLEQGWTATLAEMTARRRAGVDWELTSRMARHWPLGLRETLLQCLEPDPERRPATGLDLARRLELCLQPAAQSLLAPPLQNWRRFARRSPVWGVLLAVMIPNVSAAVFNYFYNRQEIVDHLQNSREAFERIQTVINAIAFPLGVFFVFWFMHPVVSAVRRSESPADFPALALQDVRKKCLRLGHLAAGISLALWLVAAPAYPIALQMEIGSIPLTACFHFIASLTLCGLIAAAYPFFGVATLAVCSFYPALVRLDSMSEIDREPLQRLGQSSWLYLLLAATVPMLAVAVLVVIGSEARFALGLLAVAGLAGFGMALGMFRLLQRDLASLTVIAASPSDPIDSTSALSRGL